MLVTEGQQRDRIITRIINVLNNDNDRNNNDDNLIVFTNDGYSVSIKYHPYKQHNCIRNKT